MFISKSVEETIAAGRNYGRAARKGDVFALRGDLGAGKTQFVKGFVAGLESKADVTSPTFVLIHEYGDGRLPVDMRAMQGRALQSRNARGEV